MSNDASREPLLAAPFDALRAEMARHNAPPGVQKELLAAFARQFPRRRWYQRLRGVQWGMALAGSGALAVLLGGLVMQPDGGTPRMAALDQDGGAFIALESRERIEQESDPQLVETDLPRTELTALGIPLTPENAGDLVRAQVLVGADGAPLALRLSLN